MRNYLVCYTVRVLVSAPSEEAAGEAREGTS